MTRIPDSELDDLRARRPVAEVAGQWVKLRRHGRGYVGPCPIHSPDPTAADSTSFEIKDNGAWVCVTCCDGGDVIKLVQLRQRLSFREAVEWLGGAAPVDAAREAELARERAAKEVRREKEANYFRERKRQELWDIWEHAQRWPGTAVEAYLKLRGLTDLPANLRLKCAPDLPYFVPRGHDEFSIHRGPVMLAPILRPDRHFGGLHMTHIDLGHPKGKLCLADPVSGAPLPAKKSHGSKAGGYIDLFPFKPPAIATRLIIGEGIEKVLAVYVALLAQGEDLTATVFRTSIDLGNLGGKAADSIAHPSLLDAGNRARRIGGPRADLDAPGIPLEDTIGTAIVLGDSTSDRFTTECAIARGAERFARERARSTLVAWPPDGMDFDDLLRGGDNGAGEART